MYTHINKQMAAILEGDALSTVNTYHVSTGAVGSLPTGPLAIAEPPDAVASAVQDPFSAADEHPVLGSAPLASVEPSTAGFAPAAPDLPFIDLAQTGTVLVATDGSILPGADALNLWKRAHTSSSTQSSAHATPTRPTPQGDSPPASASGNGITGVNVGVVTFSQFKRVLSLAHSTPNGVHHAWRTIAAQAAASRQGSAPGQPPN